MSFRPRAPFCAAGLVAWLAVNALAAAPPPALIPVATPAPVGSLAPGLAAIQPGTPGFPRGGALLSWCERDTAETVLRCAAWDGVRWSPVSTVAREARLQANWADPPGVSVGAASAGSPWIAHWTESREGADEAAEVLLAASLDQGATWGPALVPYDERTPAERGFAVLSAEGRQAGRVVWLDGRHRVESEPGPALVPGEPEPPGTEVRLADLGIGAGDDGVPHLRVLRDEVLDTRACDCCPMSLVSWPGSHRVMAFYRDRSAGEVRDISSATLLPGHAPAVTAYSRDGWKIAGCPVNGPAAVALPAGGRAAAFVVWYTAASDSPRVYAALADSTGARLGDPLRLDASHAAGRAAAVVLADGTILAAWSERRGKTATYRLAPIRHRGTKLELAAAPTELALSSPRQAPRVVAVGNRVLVAWTDPAAASPGVRLASMDFPGSGPKSSRGR